MDGKSRMFGIMLSAIINGGIVLLCAYSGLTYLDPPPAEIGILMDFEDEILEEPQVIQTEAGKEPRSETPKPEEDIKLVQKSEAQEIGTNSNVAEKATTGENGDVEIPEPPREKPIEKRALFPSANNNQKDTLAAQVANKISDALTAGHPSGNTTIGNPEGEPSAQLEGRSIVGKLPRPEYNVQNSGKVVVLIKVDKEGKVLSAVPGYTGTTVSDRTLWEAAKKAALEARFNVSRTAPNSQEGTITYIFSLK